MSESVAKSDARRASWIESVNQLCSDIRVWAKEHGWDILEEEKLITEQQIGSYSVPRLSVHYPGGRLYVEPIGTQILGAEGRVDLENYPTLNTLLLIRENGKWNVYTDARVPWPNAWGRECFYEIVKALQH